MQMCAAQAIIVQDAAGNRKMDKSKSTGRIDGMVSLAMAVGVASLDAVEPEAFSPWDDPNFSLEAA
jgi:phage terminase large subunit-like protein